VRTFNIRFAIPLGGFVNDVIAAQGINNFFGKASNITLYLNGDASGMTVNANYDDGESSVGVIPNGSAVPIASTPGKIKTNEDYSIQFAVPSGCKLLLNVQNPTGGNIFFNAQLNVA
jgi:hypothetical protein